MQSGDKTETETETGGQETSSADMPCRRCRGSNRGMAFLLLLVLLVLVDCMTAVAGQQACGACDQRQCPFLSADSCPGLVLKDSCGCCPVCVRAPDNATLEGGLGGSACDTVKCHRNEICVLNIQAIPICRCPSVFWCRRRERKDICGRDGKTYKSRCYLRIAECASGKKIRVAHKGSCNGPAGRRRGKGRTTLRPQGQRGLQDETPPPQQHHSHQQHQQNQQQRQQRRQQQRLQRQQQKVERTPKKPQVQPQGRPTPAQRQEGLPSELEGHAGVKNNRQTRPKRRRKINKKAKNRRDRIKRRNRAIVFHPWRQ